MDSTAYLLPPCPLPPSRCYDFDAAKRGIHWMLKICRTCGRRGWGGDAADIKSAQGATTGPQHSVQQCGSRPHLPTVDASPAISSQPVCFYKQLLWCEAPFGDPGGHRSPRGACGVAQLQPQQASVHGHVSNVCFLFLLCLLGRSRPCSSHTDCATRTLSHIYSHRKAYCTLYKHFDFRMKTGYTLA